MTGCSRPTQAVGGNEICAVVGELSPEVVRLAHLGHRDEIDELTDCLKMHQLRDVDSIWILHAGAESGGESC